MTRVFVLMLVVFTATIPSSQQGSCGGDLTAKDNAKEFKSPTFSRWYSTPKNCTWTIETETADRHVVMEVLYSRLDSSRNCALGNNVTVYDGDIFVMKWCGSTRPNKIVSSGNSLTVVFEKGRFSWSDGFVMKYYQTTPSTTCGGELVAGSGKSYFTSPGYPENYSDNSLCAWTIKTQDQYSFVLLETIDSQLDGDKYCRHDNVTVHDDYNNKTLHGTFCGSSAPTFKSPGHSLRVVFRSDNHTVERGFKMMYKQIPIEECGYSLTATDLPSFIKTPGYPNGYYQAINCTWTIEADTYGSTVNVDVEMNVGNWTNCRYNNLSFYKDKPRGHLRTICQSAHTIIKAKNTMTIVFTTDSSAIKRGVLLKVYQSKDPLIAPTRAVTPPTRGCGAFLTANVSDGFIYGSTYQGAGSNYHCKWTIRASNSTNRVVVDHFFSTYQYPGNCTLGNVTVYDGSGPYSTLLGKWCGIGHPTFKSSNQYLTIVFNTTSFTHSGFRLRYRETFERLNASNVTLTAGYHHRNISSPGYPLGYRINVDYYWLILADHPSFIIEISVKDADFSRLSDYVEVFDGRDASATSLGRFYGWKPVYTSTSSAVFIIFHSESSGTGRGFIFMYRQVMKNVCKEESVSLIATEVHSIFYLPDASPYQYQYQAHCYTWRITADYGSVVKIKSYYTDSTADDDMSCLYDYVAVFDGYGPSRSLLGKWCGGHLMSYTSYTREMYMEYHTTDNKFSRLRIYYSSADYTECWLPYYHKRSVKVGAIVGGVLGSVATAVIFIVLGICLWRKRKRESAAPSNKEKIAFGDASKCAYFEGEDNLAMQKKLEEAYAPPSYKDVTSVPQGIILQAPPAYPSNVNKTQTTEVSTNHLYPAGGRGPPRLYLASQIGQSVDI